MAVGAEVDQGNRVIVEAARCRGVYRLQITMGSTTTAHDAMVVSVNGGVAASDLDTDAGQFINVVHEVRVRDGALTVTFTDRGGDDGVWAVAGLIIEARS